MTTRWDCEPAECEALVVDTESRHLSQNEAAERVARWANYRPLFKKIDSTMRGPIRAELEALGSAVLLTPAYPRMGRVVRGGRLLVNGVEVAKTEFASDPLWPIRASGVAEQLGIEADSAIRICDAEMDADLAAIAREAEESGAVAAGSGGLGRQWAAGLQGGTEGTKPRFHALRPLVVCGSRHPRSIEQARRAAGLPVVLPDSANNEPAAVLRELAADACRAVRQHRPDLLILFGGDTAAAVLAAFGIHDLWAEGEVLPGIPASRTREMMVVTKAGGFGEPDVVQQILGRMR